MMMGNFQGKARCKVNLTLCLAFLLRNLSKEVLAVLYPRHAACFHPTYLANLHARLTEIELSVSMICFHDQLW